MEDEEEEAGLARARVSAMTRTRSRVERLLLIDEAAGADAIVSIIPLNVELDLAALR